MSNFKNAILRKPCKFFQKGHTTAGLGKPDYVKTLLQHTQYVKALSQIGLKIKVLKADNDYPDSTFIEDTAIIVDATNGDFHPLYSWHGSLTAGNQLREVLALNPEAAKGKSG